MPDDRARRWRLLLGDGPDDSLSPSDMGMDAALGALYDNQSDGEPGTALLLCYRQRRWYLEGVYE